MVDKRLCAFIVPDCPFDGNDEQHYKYVIRRYPHLKDPQKFNDAAKRGEQRLKAKGINTTLERLRTALIVRYKYLYLDAYWIIPSQNKDAKTVYAEVLKKYPEYQDAELYCQAVKEAMDRHEKAQCEQLRADMLAVNPNIEALMKEGAQSDRERKINDAFWSGKLDFQHDEIWAEWFAQNF